MASIEIPSGIKVLSATTVDDLGKFDAIDEPTAVALALSSIPSVLRYIGRKVLCNGVEYVFSSLADSGLVSNELIRVPTSEDSSFVLGKERYNMEIASANVTSNILTINFKKDTKGLSNIVIKSIELGITIPVAFNVIIPTFPNYRDLSVFQIDLTTPATLNGLPSYAQSDKVVTDIEFINYGAYIDDSVISFQRVSNVITINLSRDGVFDTISTNIDCPLLGLNSSNDVFYSLTRTSPTTYTLSNTGADVGLTIRDSSNYTMYCQTNIEKSNNSLAIITSDMTRTRYASSVSRGLSVIPDVDWKKGALVLSTIHSEMRFKPDPTGEFIYTPASTWSNNFSQPTLLNNRPRVGNANTSYNHYYAQGLPGGVAQIDTAFHSNQYYIPNAPSVSTHTNVVGNGTIATITCTAPHALTTGDTVIINSTPLGLVNASVVVTVTTTSVFTFPYTTVVTSQADATGYNYLTHAQRTTTTVVNTTGTLATITTSIPHGYAVGQTVFVHSGLLSLVGVPVNITAVPTTTSFSFADTTTIATATADTGYSNKSIYPFLKTVERDASNIVSLKFTSAPNQFDGTLTSVVAVGFQVGSYLRIVNTSLIGSATATPFNIQNILNEYGAVTATGAVAFPNVIQFKNTGSVLAPTLNGASTTLVNFSQKYHSRALGKAKDHRTHGWFIAGTEPSNNAGDKFMYDRLRVGYYANMGSLGWNHYTLPNVPNKSFFGRHSYFGNFSTGITQVTANDINVISEGAAIIGNTTTPATTSKGIVKFDSTTNQLSFSDGAKYFKVNEERIKFLFEGNIGNIALTKLNSVGEVNTLMSSAVYINKATEISEIYFIIGSVASGQTSGQITVTLQHVALGQTLEIDAATVGTTVATATYNFINGVTISRYVKNTLSSITGSIPADRMLFAKIQTTSPFNGGANAVQDIVVTVKLR